MKKIHLLLLSGLSFLGTQAQKVVFTEYDLKNGLHVILHKDNSAPVVAVSVMYHVGSKDEIPTRTGFAHFFEHLLFEGSDNIKRGEFMKLVSSNGGQNNAILFAKNLLMSVLLILYLRMDMNSCANGQNRKMMKLAMYGQEAILIN